MNIWEFFCNFAPNMTKNSTYLASKPRYEILDGLRGDFPLINQTPWWMVLLVMFWCFTMIPLPNTIDIRWWAETNPLNGPAWSLQWEYIANILYAFSSASHSLWQWVLAAASRDQIHQPSTSSWARSRIPSISLTIRSSTCRCRGQTVIRTHLSAHTSSYPSAFSCSPSSWPMLPISSMTCQFVNG